MNVFLLIVKTTSQIGFLSWKLSVRFMRLGDIFLSRRIRLFREARMLLHFALDIVKCIVVMNCQLLNFVRPRLRGMLV